MESKYNYFKRDISWLSFNYRVLLEATDEYLPLYERINFISIYSSNLEEFYKNPVADHKAVASGATESDEETVQSARELVEEINREVTRRLTTVCTSTNRKYSPLYVETISFSIRTDTWSRSTNNLSKIFSGKKSSLTCNPYRYRRTKSSLSSGTTASIWPYEFIRKKRMRQSNGSSRITSS